MEIFEYHWKFETMGTKLNFELLKTGGWKKVTVETVETVVSAGFKRRNF